MPMPDFVRYNSSCKVVMVGFEPASRRTLTPLLRHHLPMGTFVDLPRDPTTLELHGVLQCQTPKICLVEIGPNFQSSLELIPALLRFDSKLPITVVLPPNETDLILRCLRLGALDFLIPPFTEDQIESALLKSLKTLPRPEQMGPSGKVYCVMPAKGSCGATTIATSMAYQWKRFKAKRVLLADLDPLTGVISFLLKIQSKLSFVDMLSRAHDIDADLWRAMVTDRFGVDVLVAPENITDMSMELADATPIIEYARYNYDVVIADTAAPYGDWNLSLARLSDEILLVTTNELGSLQGAQRALRYLEAQGINRWKVHLVVNRFSAELGVNRETIATGLHQDIYHLLPSDYESIQKALIEGKPAVLSSRFGKSVAELTAKLAGVQPEAKKASPLASLRSVFSRGSAS